MPDSDRKTVPVITVDRMRRSDAYTISRGVTGTELMYRAARGIYEAYSGWKEKSIAIVTGGGNNGGDGYALACILKQEGCDPAVFRVSDKLSEEGRYYCGLAEEQGVPVLDLTEETDLRGYGVVVDCVLGTGFKGEVRPRAKLAIQAINESGAYVISADINSGMNGDTGEGDVVVRSDLTVSIGYYKQGLLTEKAKEKIGRLVNADIGIILAD